MLSVLREPAGTRDAAWGRESATIGDDVDVPSTWRAALAGESGVDFIKAFDPSDFPVRIAGEIKDFDPATVVSAKEARSWSAA